MVTLIYVLTAGGPFKETQTLSLALIRMDLITGIWILQLHTAL